MYGAPRLANETLLRLRALSRDDRPMFALDAARIIGESMVHLSVKKLERGDADFTYYRYTIPAWDNWILWMLRWIRPTTFKAYEYCSWRHAVRRGIGQCGQMAMAVAGFLAEQGFKTALVSLRAHVVAMAQVEHGTWYVLDPDFRAYVPHNLSYLKNNEAILLQYYAHNSRVREKMYDIYFEQSPRISYGTADSLYPRGCMLERIAVVAKWGVPVLLLVVSILWLMARYYRFEHPYRYR